MNPVQEDALFEESFEAATQFMLILDPEGRILRANRAALEVTGLSPAQVANAPLWLIPWTALKSQNRRALRQAVAALLGAKGGGSGRTFQGKAPGLAGRAKALARLQRREG